MDSQNCATMPWRRLAAKIGRIRATVLAVTTRPQEIIPSCGCFRAERKSRHGLRFAPRCTTQRGPSHDAFRPVPCLCSRVRYAAIRTVGTNESGSARHSRYSRECGDPP